MQLSIMVGTNFISNITCHCVSHIPPHVWSNFVSDKSTENPFQNQTTPKFSMRNQRKIFIAKDAQKADLHQEIPENDRCMECNAKNVELGSSSHDIPICVSCCNADRSIGISCSSSSSASSTSRVGRTRMDNSSGRKRRRHRNKETLPKNSKEKKKRRGGALYRGIVNAWIGRARHKEGRKLTKGGPTVKCERRLSAGSIKGDAVRQELSLSERLQIWSLSSDFWLKAYCLSITTSAALFWIAWWI